MRVGAEARRPRVEADDGKRRVAFVQVVFLVKEPSERRLHTEDVEVVAGREIAPGADRRSGALEIDRRDAVADQAGKRDVLIAQIAIVWKRLRREALVRLQKEQILWPFDR